MKKFFILDCHGELRTIADYTAAEIESAFWENPHYTECGAYHTLEAAEKALENCGPAYTGIESGFGCRFIGYRFFCIQSIEYDDDGEITDVHDCGELPCTAVGFPLRYKVTFCCDNAAQVAGIEPHSATERSLDDYVAAKYPETAVDLAMDYLIDRANTYGGYYAESDGNGRINVYDCEGGTLIEQYYNFTAEIVG